MMNQSIDTCLGTFEIASDVKLTKTTLDTSSRWCYCVRVFETSCFLFRKPAHNQMRHQISIVIFFVVLAISLQSDSSYPRSAKASQSTSVDKLVDPVRGKLHINCSGNVDRRPVVILEAGLNSSSDTWSGIQPEIAKFTRVCSYDRAGIGKSDAPQQQPRTSSQIAIDLHTLLDKEGVAGPVVLVGHSFGGLLVRMYASFYPRDVVGMVLIDSVHEEETAKWLAMIPIDTRKQMEAGNGMQLLGSEQVDLKKSDAEMQAAHWHTDIPLFVLSRGKASYSADDYPPPLRSFAPKGEELRLQMQADLARRSTRGKHIFAERSGHMIHQDQPELVVDTIRQVVEATRPEHRRKV